MNVSTKSADTGQVSASAAEIYDAFFVPALFGAWARPLCETAGLAPAERVLDVACGTGATTRRAQEMVGTEGQVTGLDCNDGMLAVARSRTPGVGFVPGRAEALPFDDGAFDAVLCQFGLMFFEDRPAALREMMRVTRPGGRVALSVWDRVETTPGYARMIGLIDRLFGAEAADALRAAFCLGDREKLVQLLEDGGMAGAKIESRVGKARFASVEEWVRMDVKGWTLAEIIDDRQFAALVAAAERDCAEFAGVDGTVAFDAPAHLITCETPRPA